MINNNLQLNPNVIAGPLLRNASSSKVLYRTPISVIFSQESIFTDRIIQMLMDQNKIKQDLFTLNQLYGTLFLPKNLKRLHGIDHLASNLLSQKESKLVIKHYLQYSLRAGKIQTDTTVVKAVKRPSFFQRVKKNLSNTFSKVEAFISNNPKISIIICIILVVVFLGTVIFSFSGGTSTSPKKAESPSPSAPPSGNPEQTIPPDDGLVITEDDSQHVSVVPKPWDGIGHEDYAGKSVPCNHVDESIVDYFKIAKETGKLPRILDKALKRILALDDQTLGEHNILDLFTEKEIDVLFDQTDFLSLPAVKTIIERNEYCVFEVA